MRHRLNRILTIFMALVFACTALAACEDEGETLSERVASGNAVQVERGTGSLDIKRTTPSGKRPKGIEDDTWTVLIYLCGSDLESDNGAATADLSEMVAGAGSEQVSFIVETGGAKKWQGDVKSNKMQRFLIQDGSIMEVGKTKQANMGEPDTLVDFISWGVENYPADHLALILWDHGGGSISGVCFDERSDFDSLTLPELSEALASANDKLWQKFDFVGFDACLMSTLETANALASYSDYMIASEETEPASGWEYSSFMEYLAQNPSADGGQIGRALCESYLDSLDRSDTSNATLSVVDLSQIDNLLQSFYHFSQEMYAAGVDQGTLAAMSRSIRSAENYGGNNWLEGYTNMVDLAGIVDACAEVTPSAEEVKSALKAAVPYQVLGRRHAESCGISTYYPLSLDDADELVAFTKVAANPSYLSFVDRLAHGATYDGGDEYENYDDEEWFEGSFWEWLFSDEELSEEQEEAVQEEATEYWSYVNDHTGESHLISFDEEPQIDEEGTYWFRLDEHGLDNTVSVSGLVYALSDDGEDWFALGETYDVYGDWDTGEFYDGFDGMWLSLPDGQNLCLYVEATDEDSVLYTSPISLNGEDCYLRLTQNFDTGEVTVEGAWAGVSENGASSRGTTPLSKGDVIVPLYSAFSTVDNARESIYEGEAYKVQKGGLTVDYDYLPTATYRYSFRIEDAFGDSMITDEVEFQIDTDGSIYFFD